MQMKRVLLILGAVAALAVGLIAVAGAGAQEGPAAGGRPCRAQAAIIDAAAEVLGMEKDELKAKLEEGMSLAEVAEEQGMTVEDFTAALTAEVEADLQA